MADEKCSRCSSKSNLQGHHRNYDNLGNESDDDLEILCENCHPVGDHARKERNKKVHEWKRLDGWATKVYGKDWTEKYSLGYVKTKFSRWLKDMPASVRRRQK